MYKILKVEGNRTIADYGSGYCKEDVEAICKGYRIDWELGVAFRIGTDKAFYITEQ